MRKARVLVVDDEKLIRWSLEKNLVKEGFEVDVAVTGEEALEKIHSFSPDAVLLDNKLPGRHGLDILPDIKAYDPSIAVIFMTAYGTIETAVQAIKAGAFDYVNKPLVFEEINLLLRNALEKTSLEKEVRDLRAQVKERYGFNNIIGESASMTKLFELVKKVANSEASTVLLQGESGTGKDLIARVIHYESRRAQEPFMAISCASLPEQLLESELFGHEKGAFTDAKSQKLGQFELAAGGTVYLDEIGDLNLGLQVKLLRFIEEKTFKRLGGNTDIEVDVRIIAATHKDLDKAVQEGRFRQDLFYRLKVIPIYIEPLRKRLEDIVPLLKFFLTHYNQEFGKKVHRIGPGVEKIFKEYTWPGNVRELRNIVERIVLLESGDTINIDALPPDLMIAPMEKSFEELDIEIPERGLPLEKVEYHLLLKALEKAHHNQTKAARLLDISRDALRYKMKKHGLL
jgi:two-component system response regulator AtoC